MARAACDVALLCLVALDANAADDVVVADAIAYRFPWLLSSHSLHDSTFRFPDGVKGALVFAPIAARVMPDPPRADLAADDRLAWATYCASTAIVRATNVASSGVPTTAKDAIFTRSTFRIDDVVKGSGTLTVGDEVVTMRPGGEVDDAGERLRVVVGAIDTPVVGSHWLLELVSLERDGHGDRYLRQATALYDPDAPLRTDFGFMRNSYAEFARDLRRAASIAPCPGVPR